MLNATLAFQESMVEQDWLVQHCCRVKTSLLYHASSWRVVVSQIARADYVEFARATITNVSRH